MLSMGNPDVIQKATKGKCLQKGFEKSK